MNNKSTEISETYSLITYYKYNELELTATDMDSLVKHVSRLNCPNLVVTLAKEMGNNKLFTIKHKTDLANALVSIEDVSLLDLYTFIDDTKDLPPAVIDRVADEVAYGFNNEEKILFVKMLSDVLPIKSKMKMAMAISHSEEEDANVAEACLEYATTIPGLPAQTKMGLAKTVCKKGDLLTRELFATNVEGLPQNLKNALLGIQVKTEQLEIDGLPPKDLEECEEDAEENVEEQDNGNTSLALQIDITDLFNLN